MIYQEAYINEKGQLDFRNTTIEGWIDRQNWAQHAWVHHLINFKSSSGGGMYDLYGPETVRAIHDKMKLKNLPQ